MPVHKFINLERRMSIEKEKSKIKAHPVEFMPKRVDGRIVVYAQKDLRIGLDPKMIALGLSATIGRAPFWVSLPNELRHRKLGLINSVVMESCDNIVVSIGYMGDYGNGNMMGRRRRTIDDVDPGVLIPKGSPLCILMTN